MLKFIKTYFILILYIFFTIGVIVENHSACDSCEISNCDIEHTDSENDHDCEHSSCKITNTNSTEHHCSCTAEIYKLDNNYVNEYKLKVASSIDYSFSILYANFNSETFLNQTTKDRTFYIKIPDKNLFHKFSIYELASILC